MSQATAVSRPAGRTSSLADGGESRDGEVSGRVRGRVGFLVGPWFDLIFVANLYWPILILLGLYGGEQFHTSALFWQVYFVTAPHRWITLLLVAADRGKTAGRGLWFVTVAAVVVIGCLDFGRVFLVELHGFRNRVNYDVNDLAKRVLLCLLAVTELSAGVQRP